MRDSVRVLQARIQGQAQSIDFCDCALGRRILMNARRDLQEKLRVAIAQQNHRAAGYMGRAL